MRMVDPKGTKGGLYWTPFVCHPRSMWPHLPSAWGLVTCFVLQLSRLSKNSPCYSHSSKASPVVTPTTAGGTLKTVLHRERRTAGPWTSRSAGFSRGCMGRPGYTSQKGKGIDAP